MSRYILMQGLVFLLAGLAQTGGQQQPNKPPEKAEPLQVKFLSSVAKGERTLLIFEMINSSALPIGYNGSQPKDSEVFPNQMLAPHLEVRVRDLKTGKSRDLNRQTLDHNVTLSAKGNGRFEVPLPPGDWDELSVGVRWFEMRADPAQSRIAWSAPITRKATTPGPLDFSFIQPPAPKVKGMDSTPVAVGGWSEPVRGLRGRLVLAQRQQEDSKARETSVYLDLHHIAEAVGPPLHVRVDPKQRIELQDAAGKPVPGGILNSGGHPELVWVTLPYDCTMRVRLSAYNVGAEDGLIIPLLSNLWRIPAGTKGEFSLTGTFVCDVQAQGGNGPLWLGTLALPKATFTLPQMQVASESDYQALHGRYLAMIRTAAKAEKENDVSKLTDRFNELIGGKLLFAQVISRVGAIDKHKTLLNKFFGERRITPGKINPVTSTKPHVAQNAYGMGYVIVITSPVANGQWPDDLQITLVLDNVSKEDLQKALAP